MSANDRLELQAILTAICPNTYYCPPPTMSMTYPAIRYERYRIDNDFADNLPYNNAHAYTVTVISANPDDPIVDSVSKLQYASYDRHYFESGLCHDVFTLYYK